MDSNLPNSSKTRLEALLREYGARLRALIASHGLAKHGIDPDDVEQEVRIRLWQALERDRNVVLRASYIQRVVLTVVVDRVRRAKVRLAEPLPEDDEPVLWNIDTNASPEQRSRDDQFIEVVTRCLASLPETRRVALAFHLQGYSWDETAELTGVSAEAARKLAARGLAELKTQLMELGFGEFDDEN